MLLDRNLHPQEDASVPSAPFFSLTRPFVACLRASVLPLLVLNGCQVSDNSPSKGSGGGGSSAGTAPGAGTGNGAGNGPGGTGAAGSSQGGSGTGGAAGGAGGVAGGAGGAAGGGGAVTTASCSPDYLLCEDFEATAVDSVPKDWTAHGKAAVAEDQASHGKRSLKVSPADNGERRIYHPTAMLGAAHWGRVNYRVQLPTPDAFVHSTLVTFFGKGPTVGDAEFRLVDTVKDAKTGGFAGGKHQFLYNVQPQGAEFGTGSDYDYTFEDKWHCAEWHVDAATQTYEFFYDGKQVISFTKGAGKFDGSELPNAFAEVRLGWNNYQSAPPGFTAWLDDFAVDDQRVGCLP
jgi:hypothetical protein